MKRVRGRKRLVRAAGESDDDSEEEEGCQVPAVSRRSDLTRVARSTIESDPYNDEEGCDRSPFKKRARRGPLRFLEKHPAVRAGDISLATSSDPETGADVGDVIYVKMERMILKQTFLTSWCVRRG